MAIGVGRSCGWGALTLAALLFTACEDATGPDPDPSLAVLEGNEQTHLVGCAVPISVEVSAPGGSAGGVTMSFEVGEGGGAINPPRATVGSDGIARATWTLGEGTNTATASVDAPVELSVSLSAQGVPVAPGGYGTVGNQIISSATCQPHRFIGVSRPGLEWAPAEWRLSNVARTAEDLERIKEWNVNVVRIPVSQIFWVPTSSRYDPRYPALVERLVRQAREAGLDVILDLHTSDRGDPDFAGKIEIQQMADVAHSVPFWRDVATRFKDDGGVMFELFNEPNGITWDVWLNGGMIPGGAQYGGDQSASFKKPYQAAGMQQLYDVVRGTGAKNLVILGGTHWGFYLDQVPSHRVKGYNIAYATHPYDYSDKQPSSWDKAFGGLIATDPVIITEFGVRSCNRPYLQAVLDYADKHQLSWIAWAWWTPPDDTLDRADAICRFPALISDWTGTPSVLGEVIRSRIATYGG